MRRLRGGEWGLTSSSHEAHSRGLAWSQFCRTSQDFIGFHRVSQDFIGFQRISQHFSGFQRISQDFIGETWTLPLGRRGGAGNPGPWPMYTCKKGLRLLRRFRGGEWGLTSTSHQAHSRGLTWSHMVSRPPGLQTSRPPGLHDSIFQQGHDSCPQIPPQAQAATGRHRPPDLQAPGLVKSVKITGNL